MNAAVIVETIRRHVTRPGFVVFLVFLALAGVAASSFNVPASVWPSLVGLLSIVAGAQLIGPEFSSGALQLIVSKPIRRSVYVMSRVAGVVASIAIAATIAVTAEVAARAVFSSQPIPSQRIALAFVGSLSGAIQTVAMLTLFGALTRSYFNAAIYLGAEAGLSTLQALLGVVRVKGAAGAFLEQHPIVEHTVTAIDNTLYPDPPLQLDPMWFGRVAVVAVVALALACVAFERREVPYGSE